eukprot:jgi/Mesvir1/7158/Mv02518-RA.1
MVHIKGERDARKDSRPTPNSFPCGSESLDLAERYLVCSMFEDAATTAEEILREELAANPPSSMTKNRLHEIQGDDAGDIAGRGIVTAAMFVLIQAFHEMQRHEELTRVVIELFRGVSHVPAEVVVLWASLQVSAGAYATARHLLSLFLQNASLLSERHRGERYIVVGDGNVLSGRQFLALARLYAVDVLARGYRDVPAARKWLMTESLPLTKRQMEALMGEVASLEASEATGGRGARGGSGGRDMVSALHRADSNPRMSMDLGRPSLDALQDSHPFPNVADLQAPAVEASSHRGAVVGGGGGAAWRNRLDEGGIGVPDDVSQRGKRRGGGGLAMPIGDRDVGGNGMSGGGGGGNGSGFRDMGGHKESPAGGPWGGETHRSLGGHGGGDGGVAGGGAGGRWLRMARSVGHSMLVLLGARSIIDAWGAEEREDVAGHGLRDDGTETGLVIREGANGAVPMLPEEGRGGGNGNGKRGMVGGGGGERYHHGDGERYNAGGRAGSRYGATAAGQALVEGGGGGRGQEAAGRGGVGRTVAFIVVAAVLAYAVSRERQAIDRVSRRAVTSMRKQAAELARLAFSFGPASAASVTVAGGAAATTGGLGGACDMRWRFCAVFSSGKVAR